ncbi:hypothetical protein [Streptomyces dysideae]|uniref:Uncharacterized protein n=1 Tax=Streptomyces dysideae TaxID=909626 RepID=A0A101UQ38_9ACTN|nr:hypothetical protein [Streptomyces dysideae]KUO14763.1 hypothetical protein AQJ91_44955 [Streptomyces dysideae]
MLIATVDPRTQGRESYRRLAWRDAYEQMRAADRQGRLEPDDLDRMARSAYQMLLRPDLLPEVTEFVERLGWRPPASFTAETVSLFRFHSQDWKGHWWTTLTWEHVRSWTLEPAAD